MRIEKWPLRTSAQCTFYEACNRTLYMELTPNVIEYNTYDIIMPATPPPMDPFNVVTAALHKKKYTMHGSRKFFQRESNFDYYFLVDELREDPNTTIKWPSSALQ